MLRENPGPELVLLSKLRLHGRVLFSALESRYRIRWFGWEYPGKFTPFNVIPFWVWEFVYFARLRNVTKRRTQLILIVHFISLQTVVAILFKRVYHCKLVLYGIGSDVRAPMSRLQERFLQWTLRRADIVFCVNTDMKRRLAELGRGDGIVLPTPFIGGPTLAGEPQKTFDVVNVGNLLPLKEHEALLKSLKYVGHPIKTAILGDGPLMSYLQDLSSEQKGGGVRFFGQVPHERVWEILRESKVYVHTCRVEGMPASLLEAVWCGLPVVAVAGPYLGDMIETYGFRIRVVPGDSPVLLGRTIADVLGNYPSHSAEAIANKDSLRSYQDRWQSQFDCALARWLSH